MKCLGIDLGTTSTKVVVYDNDSESILYSSTRVNNAYIEVEDAKHREQSVAKIILSLEGCLTDIAEKVGPQAMEEISVIGVCGQMHGCMFWNNSEEENNVFPSETSTLITWQDQRCSEEFLQTLPKSENSLPISTGFGCASIFWLQNNAPAYLKKFSTSGTIMDFVVANFCGLPKPVISCHNAVSWGYFCPSECKWEKEILQKGNFPVDLLPDVKENKVVGCLKQDWMGLKKGTKILNGLGDMQCSVYSCSPESNDAVFNLGTSAQYSMVVNIEKCTNLQVESSATIVPYFDEDVLVTSASLNGGAVYEEYMKMLLEWTRRFAPDVCTEEIYNELAKGECQVADNIKIRPTLFGERHEPSVYASVSNIQPQHLNFHYIARILAESTIKNTTTMFKGGVNLDLKPDRVWACGSAFARNDFFRDVLRKDLCQSDVRFDRNMDASYGVAIFASNNYDVKSVD